MWGLLNCSDSLADVAYQQISFASDLSTRARRQSPFLECWCFILLHDETAITNPPTLTQRIAQPVSLAGSADQDMDTTPFTIKMYAGVFIELEMPMPTLAHNVPQAIRSITGLESLPRAFRECIFDIHISKKIAREDLSFHLDKNAGHRVRKTLGRLNIAEVSKSIRFEVEMALYGRAVLQTYFFVGGRRWQLIKSPIDVAHVVVKRANANAKPDKDRDSHAQYAQHTRHEHNELDEARKSLPQYRILDAPSCLSYGNACRAMVWRWDCEAG